MFDPERVAKVMADLIVTDNAQWEPCRVPATLWHVVDSSKAEMDVGYPGDLISTHGTRGEAKIGLASALVRLSSEWFPVSVTPPERKLLMVTGDSGYMPHRQFLELAHHDNVYRPPINGHIRWLNVQNDQLLDKGWVPTHWAHPILLPKVGD